MQFDEGYDTLVEVNEEVETSLADNVNVLILLEVLLKS